MTGGGARPGLQHLMTPLEELADRLEHRFADWTLLRRALTHPSVGGGHRSRGERAGALAFERLEFLGDRVLAVIIAEWLLEAYPDEPEGSLSRRLSASVRAEAVGEVARALGLGEHLRLSPGESTGGGREKASILADAGEAVLGAVFLDGGLEAARRMVRRHWKPIMARSDQPPQDAKTRLQEWAQGRGKPLPVYEIVKRTGPAHRPSFEVSVTIEGEAPAGGSGSARRVAEQVAAEALLRRLGVLPASEETDSSPESRTESEDAMDEPEAEAPVDQASRAADAAEEDR